MYWDAMFEAFISLYLHLCARIFHFRTLPLPSVDRSTKPPSLLSPSIHSRIGLRNVIVPSRLMGKFMNLAQRNTNQNIETCGILAGTIVSNLLTTLGRYTSVASVGTFCFSAVAHGIAWNEMWQIFVNKVQNLNCIYKEINLYSPRMDVCMKNVCIIWTKNEEIIKWTHLCGIYYSDYAAFLKSAVNFLVA